MSQNHILSNKTLDFAVRIVNLYKYLTEEKREYIMSKQIMRSGTNPGAMIIEGLNAESDADFVHKYSIAQKEIGETSYWLTLLLRTNILNESEHNSLKIDADEIMRLIRSAILTKKQNMKKKES